MLFSFVFLSIVRCRFAYGPADPSLLFQEIQIGFGFTFLVPAHLGSPRQNPESRKMVVGVVALIFPGLFSVVLSQVIG